jgi:hypothetical protein
VTPRNQLVYRAQEPPEKGAVGIIRFAEWTSNDAQEL